MKLSAIHPNTKNPRRITQQQADRLAKSIEQFPQMMELRPIIVDADGMVLGGNMRYMALKRAGYKDLPDSWVKRADELTAAQKREFIIKDNSSFGEWDWDALANEWDDLPLGEWGINVPEDWAGPGKAKPSDADPQIDRAAELNKKWHVKTGDLFLIGDHRLLCGDSTNREDVGRLLGERHPVMMVTDPPYGVEYDPTWRARARVNTNTGKMGKVDNDDQADWSETWRLFQGDVVYVYHAGVMSRIVQESLEGSGFEIRAQIIWAKDRMVLSRGDYHWKHEPCWYAVRKGASGRRNSDRSQTTLWEIPAREDDGHGTQKPVECMARPMRNHDAPEVYDPFLGSGTTMVAAQNLDRKCYGIEINPDYCAVVLERMATAFPEIKIERANA